MNIEFSSKNFKNMLFFLYILTKESIKYLYFRDEMKYIKDICKDIELFNVTYIKIIQGICVNSLLFSKKQIDYLQKYTNQVPYTLEEKNEEIIKLLEKEEVIFDSKEPINAGIVALVYKGKYKNKEVAIKILKKNIKIKLLEALEDIKLLGYISKYIPYLNQCNLDDFFCNNSESIWNQLDLRKELNNIKNFQEFSSKVDYLKIPDTYDDITNKYENVLVMEFLYGKNLSQILTEDRESILNNLNNIIKINFVSAFFYGIGHSDLHAGNILFQEDKIALIDFGIGYKINKEEQNAIYNFYNKIFIENNIEEGSNSIFKLVNNIELINNLSCEKKKDLLNKLQKLIKEYYINNPDILKFCFYLNKELNKYNLKISKGFSEVIFGVASGLNISCELIVKLEEKKLDNPMLIYQKKYMPPILKALMQESLFELD